MKRPGYLRSNIGQASITLDPVPNQDGSYIGSPPPEGTPCTIRGLCLQCPGCGCQPDKSGTVKNGKCSPANVQTVSVAAPATSDQPVMAPVAMLPSSMTKHHKPMLLLGVIAVLVLLLLLKK